MRQIRERYGQKVVLVGWSLGGIFARELAKRHPEIVAKVVTMGTPFSGSPYANNAWRAYQLVTGHSVEQPPVEVADRGQAAGRNGRAVEPARRRHRAAQRLRPPGRARPRGGPALHAHRLRQFAPRRSRAVLRELERG